jgi:hypothetical protein
MDGWMQGCVDGWVCVSISGCMGGWMNSWMDL